MQLKEITTKLHQNPHDKDEKYWDVYCGELFIGHIQYFPNSVMFPASWSYSLQPYFAKYHDKESFSSLEEGLKIFEKVIKTAVEDYSKVIKVVTI